MERTSVLTIALCLAPAAVSHLAGVQRPLPTGPGGPPYAAASILLLMVNPQGDTGSLLRRSLTDGAPVVRSAAPRVVAAANRADLLEALAEAFARESAGATQVEQANALLALGGVNGLSLVESKLATGASALAMLEPYSAWLVRNQPERFIE
jgi:hypothetical protein